MNTKLMLVYTVMIVAGLFQIVAGLNAKAENWYTEEVQQAEYDCQMTLAERGDNTPDEIAEICQP